MKKKQPILVWHLITEEILAEKTSKLLFCFYLSIFFKQVTALLADINQNTDITNRCTSVKSKNSISDTAVLPM